MIVDFTVENCLSIKDEQLLSMVVEKDFDHLSGNIYQFNDKISLLKVAAILGPNGSGKTNMIFALDSLIDMATRSDMFKEGDNIPYYVPYELSDSSLEEPTKFEIEFITGGDRYSYYIEFDEINILKESLNVYHSTKPSKIFDRTSPENWQDDDGISFGAQYKGGKKRHAFFHNNSYLAIAGSKPDSPQLIRDIYNYFRKKITAVLNDSQPTMLGWETDKSALNAMKCLMSNLGLGIADFEIEYGDIDEKQEKFLSTFPKHMREKVKKEISKSIKYGHYKEDGTIHFIDDDYESLGTRKLFDYLPNMLHSLRHGTTLVIDEVSTNFHSHVLDLIVKLYNDPDVNVNNAQLIFTTHDIMIMKSKSLRKDQIYLAEKTNGATDYFSLDDFDSSLRNNSPFEKWYYDGRLGAVPELEYDAIARNVLKVVSGDNNA